MPPTSFSDLCGFIWNIMCFLPTHALTNTHTHCCLSGEPAAVSSIWNPSSLTTVQSFAYKCVRITFQRVDNCKCVGEANYQRPFITVTVAVTVQGCCRNSTHYVKLLHGSAQMFSLLFSYVRIDFLIPWSWQTQQTHWCLTSNWKWLLYCTAM